MTNPTMSMPDGTATGSETDRDPTGARWAYLSAATGTAANALLVGFFAAIPVAGRGNPLGPANDIVGSVATACMIPAAVAIGRRLPSEGPLCALQVATLGGLGLSTAAGPLLVAGVIPFAFSAAVSTSAFGVQAAWIGLGSRWLGRHRGLPTRTARLGQICAWTAFTGAGAAAGSLVAPEPLRAALLAAGVAAGAAVFLTVPGWWALMGRWLDSDASAVASAEAAAMRLPTVGRWVSRAPRSAC